MGRARKKSQSGRGKPRASRIKRDDVIDAEVVEESAEQPRIEPPPIVVHVKASPEQNKLTSRSGANVNAVAVRAVVREVKEAVEIGRALGDLFAAVFRR